MTSHLNDRGQVEQLQRDVNALNARNAHQCHSFVEAKRDLDITMNEFLKEEGVGNDKTGLFNLTFQQVGFGAGV